MKYYLAVISTISLVLLAGCAQNGPLISQPINPDPPTTNPPTTNPPSIPESLGLMEIVLGGVGTVNMQSQAIFHPRADITSQELLTSNILAEGLQLRFGSNGTFDVAEGATDSANCDYSNGTRYVYARFDVRNAGKNGVAYPDVNSNITFLAVDVDTNSNGTNAIARFEDSSGNSSFNETLANCVTPIHGMIDDPVEGPVVRNEMASFQAFDSTEIPEIVNLSGVEAAFPYGFVVNNKLGGRTLSADPAPDQYEGTITFAVRFPIQSTAAANPFKISMFFEVFTDTVTRVTESLEEQGTDNVDMRVESLLNANMSNIEVLLLGSSPTVVPSDITSQRLCELVVSSNESLIESNYCDYPDGRIYVDNTRGAADNTGKSWDDAMLYLNDALAIARTGDAKEIWVAASDLPYYPHQASQEENIRDYRGGTPLTVPDATFYITEGIKLYGGFSGTETSLAERSALSFPGTILSGDIGQDDRHTLDATLTIDISDILGENSFHVMYLNGGRRHVNITDETIVDGFTINAGFAPQRPSTPRQAGSGIYCDGSESGNECSPIVRNLYLLANKSFAGSGMHLESYRNGKTNPLLANIVFFGNGGGNFGGGLWVDCRDGGVSDYTLINATFVANKATRGGAIYNRGANDDGSQPTASCHANIVNSIFWDNTVAFGEGGSIYNHYTTMTLTNNLIQNASVEGGAGIFTTENAITTIEGALIETDPLFVNIADGNFDTHLQLGSPAIDAGDVTFVPTDLSIDLDGNMRIQGGTVDLGAYEYTP